MGASGYITLSIAEAVERETTFYYLGSNTKPTTPTEKNPERWSTELTSTNGTIWSSKLTEYTDGTFHWSEPVVDITNSIKDFVDTSDGKVQVFMFETVGENTVAEKMTDKNPEDNDLVFFYNENEIYKYDGENYNLITSETIQNILHGVYDEGKEEDYMITVYSSSSEPNSSEVESGDIWIELGNIEAYYQYIDNEWIAAQLFSFEERVNNHIFNPENEAYKILNNNSINGNLIKQSQQISIDEEGIDITALGGEDASSMHLDSRELTFQFKGEKTKYSAFSTDYARFGYFKFWLTQDGGMAIGYDPLGYDPLGHNDGRGLS